MDVVELVKGFSTSHQRPQADDVVADQLRRALVTGRLTLPRQSFVAAAHGASMASSGTACPQMTPVMEQPQRSASVADAQVHAIHSHHIDFCAKRPSALLTLLAVAGALSWSELVTGLAQDDGGYRLSACGALHRLHMWSHHRLIHAVCAAFSRHSMHAREHMNMPRATDCQVVTSVCQTSAELS